jgi:Ca2+-binding RTX toxin-like protein
MHIKSIGSLGAAAALTLGAMAVAQPALATTPTPTSVTFTGETPGARPNGYATAAVPGVLFSDTSGADLQVGDFGDQSDGIGLAVFGDDASALEIRLTGPTTGIRLAFGNDDPGVVNGTDQAELRLYRGATQVGQADVNVNANDKLDQTIGYGGHRLFNRAVFQYVDAAGVAKDLIEVVDDIEVAPICTIAGDDGADVLVGTPGPDVICGDAGNDVIRGAGGNDLLYGGPGRDVAKGGTGDDTVFGGSARDHVSGSSGNDDVRGGTAGDVVAGGSGRDELSGDSGRDHCDGGTGHDHSHSCEVKRRLP